MGKCQTSKKLGHLLLDVEFQRPATDNFYASASTAFRSPDQSWLLLRRRRQNHRRE